MNTQAKKEALAFLMSQKVGVLSTVVDNKPHGAYIYYIVDEDLSIYFTTVVDTKKYKNIVSNPNVAFTVGMMNPPQTVQVEGIAEQVIDENTIKALTASYVDEATENNHHPVPITKLNWHEGSVMYKIRPTVLKWADFIKDKNVITII